MKPKPQQTTPAPASYEPIARGAYAVEVYDLDPSFTSAAGNVMTKITLRVRSADTKLNGRRLWVYLGEHNRTFKIATSLVEALGFWPGDDSDPDATNAIGKFLKVFVEIDGENNKVTRFLGRAVASAPAAPAGADEEVPF